MQDYQKLAARTINNGLISMELQEIQAANFALGLSDEYFEFLEEVYSRYSREKIMDEAADPYWYANGLATIYNIVWNELKPVKVNLDHYVSKYLDPTGALLLDYGKTIGAIQSFVKKRVFHKKEKPLQELIELFQIFEGQFQALCIFLEIDPEEVKRKNIEKLEKRHSTSNGGVAFSFVSANSYRERGGE